MSIRTELNDLRSQAGIYEKKEMTVEEVEQCRDLLRENKPLPEGVFWVDPSVPIEQAYFVRYEASGLNKDETLEFLIAKCFSALDTIKTCVVFFTVLTVIEIIAGVILAFSIL